MFAPSPLTGEGGTAGGGVKTSNPSSGELQDLIAGDRQIYQAMGDLNQRIAKDTVGKYGYTIAGAVTGATYPSDIRDLRPGPFRSASYEGGLFFSRPSQPTQSLQTALNRPA